MNRKTDARRLWEECFNDSPNWLDLYFDRVFADDNLLMKYVDGHAASSLQLLPYTFNYMGNKLSAAYVSGACTSRRYRRAGYMAELMRDALKTSFNRGDAIMCLIPASRPLFYYYDKFGFDTVFFIKEERYTPVHPFHPSRLLRIVEDPETHEVYEYYHFKELEMNGRILHSANDFDNIVWDNREDDGRLLAVKDPDGAIKGFLVCVPGEENDLVVKELIVDNDDASNTLLEYAKHLFPDREIVVDKPLDNKQTTGEARAMLRIINVLTVLDTVAAKNPQIEQYIKISDPEIESNNHIFHIAGGRVDITDGYSGRLTNEVDIKTLAGVLFNTPATGELFGLPATRPSMSLMLE